MTENKLSIEKTIRYFTIGDIEKQAYLKSIDYYKQVSNEVRTRDRKKYNEAQFGLAMVLEEIDKPEEALEIYKVIVNEYEVPNIVKMRIQKINERSKRKKI